MISQEIFWFPFAVVLLMCSGCIREKDQTISRMNFGSNEPGVVGPVTFERNGVLLKAVLDGHLANGKLFLTMHIENGRPDEITIDLSNINLSIDDGRDAIPDSQGPVGVATIKPGRKAAYKLSYHPVNDVSFYERTDYRGDMKKKYSLRIDFIKDREGTLLMDDVAQFEFGDKFYNVYLQTAREKNMRIFDFGFDADDFVKDQQKYLDKIFSDADGAREIFALNPALTIDRTIINFRAFSEGDTLTIDMRMLNQSSHTLEVITNRCMVSLSGKKIKPCKLFSDSFSGKEIDSVYTFKPGTRLHLHLKYYIAKEARQWKLVADWLLIHQSGAASRNWKATPFLYADIPFKESSITRNEL